jgi:hypothetical protein
VTARFARGICAGWPETGSSVGALTSSRKWPFPALYRTRVSPGLACGISVGSAGRPAVDCAKPGNKRCRFAGNLAGATGLEPATSGVTDRYKLNRYSRLRPGITGQSRHFVAERTGCDRLRPATTRQGLCSTCVVELLTIETTGWCGLENSQPERRFCLKRSTSYLPCAPIGNWSEPTATVFACPSRFQGRPLCHRLRPLCSINAPSSVVPKGNTEQGASGLGSICYAVAVPVLLRRAVRSGSVRMVISRGGRGHPRCSQSVATPRRAPATNAARTSRDASAGSAAPRSGLSSVAGRRG